MAKHKNIAELEAENRLLREGQNSSAIASVVNTLIRWGGVVLISRYGYLSVVALAAHHTIADIGIKVLGNIQVSQALAWLLGAGGVAYGVGQNKLRKKSVEHLSGRSRAKETDIDAKRSSSQLTAQGETRPEDKL